MLSTSAASSPEAPALPQKSNMRASRFLAPIMTKAVLADEQPPLSPGTAPHDVYLSSEEDASSSADDFSDYLSDYDSSDVSPDSPDLRTSVEDTARVVTVVFQGKPSIVHTPRRVPTPPSPLPLGTHAIQRIQRTATEPVMDRRSSSSSASSLFTARKTARAYTSTGLVESKTHPSFLDSDPFSNYGSALSSPVESERPKTPSSLRRKLTLSKRRSKPALNELASQSRETISSYSPSIYQTDDEAPQTPKTPRSFVSYQDLTKAARRSMHFQPPPTPVRESPSKDGVKSKLKGGFMFGRKRKE